MFRGIAMELRAHFPSELWHQFWDACFFAIERVADSALRRCAGQFAARRSARTPRAIFRERSRCLLNPYAIMVGVFAVAALALHGATFLVMRTEGPAAERARRLVPRLWPAVLVLYVAVTAATVFERGHRHRVDRRHSAAFACGAGAWLLFASLSKRERSAFAASSLFVASLLFQAAVTMYPYLLPAYPPRNGRHFDLRRVAVAGRARKRAYGDDRRRDRGRDLRHARAARRWRESSRRGVTRRVVDVRRQTLASIRPVALDARLDRQPFGARGGLRRARARPAQSGRHGEGTRAHLHRALRAARRRSPRGCVDETIELDALHRSAQRRTCKSNCSRATRSSSPIARSKSTCIRSSATIEIERGMRVPFFGNRYLAARRGARRSRQSVRADGARRHPLSAAVCVAG